MQRSIIGFCIASFLSISGSSLAQLWEVQSHVPDMEWTRDADFVNDSTVIVVGEGGVIVRSADYGETWEEVNSTVFTRLRRVTFLDEFHGWAVGENGVILHSSDGGLTWDLQESGVNTTLRGVDFVSAFNGWVVGWNGVALYTTDGGTTWEEVDVGVPQSEYGDLLDVDFATPDIGWIVGGAYYEGRILHTTDGGNTWDNVTHQSAWIGSVQALNESTAVACGQFGTVLRIQGEDTLETSLSQPSLRDIEFVDDSLGFVAGGAVVWRTLNGGGDWEPVHSAQSQIFEALAFADSARGIVGGDNYRLAITNNGGDEWHDVSPSSIRGVDFLDPLHGWCVCENGDLRRTIDGGLIWILAQTLPVTNLNGLNFVSDTEAWIVGDNGNVLHSIDAGESWDSVELPDQTAFHDIASQGDHLWIAGDVGMISHSGDRGETWETQTQGVGSWLFGIDFADEEYGIAVGGNGTVRRTDTGGESWTMETIDPGLTLCDIDVVDREFAAAGGAGGNIYRTFDGGESWSRWSFDPDVIFYSVEFLDRWSGWALGSSGTVLHTVDGGETWIQQTTPVGSTLWDFALVPPYGWAVGDENTILRYTFSEGAGEPAAPIVRSLALTAYPNPFNPTTTLLFNLTQTGKVELRVFDVTGRVVDVLANRVMPAGNHQAIWNADRFPSGIYFVRLENSDHTIAKKVILLK